MLLCTQTHHQGAVLTNSRCASNSLYLPPGLPGSKGLIQLPQANGRCGQCSRMDTGTTGRAAVHPHICLEPPTVLAKRLQDTTHVCPQGQEQLNEQMEAGFFLFLFLSPKSTHGLRASQTHPRIPALPRGDSSLFKLDPFKHLHRSLDIAGAVELKHPQHIGEERLPPSLLAAVQSLWEEERPVLTEGSRQDYKYPHGTYLLKDGVPY